MQTRLNGVLYSIKQKSLNFYKKELEKLEGKSIHAANYLQACIRTLELDLENGKSEQKSQYIPNQEVIIKLRTMGLSQNQSKFMDMMLQKKRVKSNVIHELIKMPRTESYHIMNELSDMGLIHVIPSFPKTAVLTDEENPFDLFITNKKTQWNGIETIIKELEISTKNLTA